METIATHGGRVFGGQVAANHFDGKTFEAIKDEGVIREARVQTLKVTTREKGEVLFETRHDELRAFRPGKWVDLAVAESERLAEEFKQEVAARDEKFTEVKYGHFKPFDE